MSDTDGAAGEPELGWFSYQVDEKLGAADSSVEDDPGRTIQGPVSLLLDDCIDFPLWDQGGPIEGSRLWLHDNLGISFDLIADLYRLMDRYYDGTSTQVEEDVLWQRVQVELKPHLR